MPNPLSKGGVNIRLNPLTTNDTGILRPLYKNGTPVDASHGSSDSTDETIANNPLSYDETTDVSSGSYDVVTASGRPDDIVSSPYYHDTSYSDRPQFSISPANEIFERFTGKMAKEIMPGIAAASLLGAPAHITAFAIAGAGSIAALSKLSTAPADTKTDAVSGGRLKTAGALQSWFIDLYKLTEGDMSRYMLAPHAFEGIPLGYRPGSIIGITGVKIPRDAVSQIWQDGNMPEGLKPITAADGDLIFWLHPLALRPPPKMPPEYLIHHADEERANQAAFEHISGLLKRYPSITGEAVVSSSVRTVLLFQIGGRPLETPYELKLHLPYTVINTNRKLTEPHIAKVFEQQGGVEPEASPTYYGMSIGGEITYQPPPDAMSPPPREKRIDYSFGYLVRDAGFSTAGGRLHFRIPYFALFGGGGDGASLMERLYNNLKKKNPELAPHDFVVDYLIAPYVSPALKMMNERGLAEGGFHYQNPLLKLSIPTEAVSEEEPLGWLDDPGLAIEGVAVKEASLYKIASHHQAAYVGTLLTNLWTYFATETNWAASFEGFDRGAFRQKLLAFLKENSPAAPPAGVDTALWEEYVHGFRAIMNGLQEPAIALENEVLTRPSERRYGMALSFVRGGMIFASAPSGMEYDTEASFTLMYDKIAFLTLAYPDADIRQMIEHENRLYKKAKEKAAGEGVTPESEPVSFLNYVLNEVYSPPEIARLKTAVTEHKGLVDFTEYDRLLLSAMIFNPDNGLFQRQLEAYRGLSPKRQKKVDLEHLPRTTYWFTPIAEAMIRGGRGVSDLSKEADFVRLIYGLKTYDRGPLIKWLFGRLFGISL